MGTRRWGAVLVGMLAASTVGGCAAIAGVADFAVDPCFEGCADGPTTDGRTDGSVPDGPLTDDGSPDGGVDAPLDSPPPPSPGKSVVTLSGTGVAVGQGVIATLVAKDDTGVAVMRTGAKVVFTTKGGTSVVTSGTVVDDGDGTYRAILTGVTEGTKLEVSAMLDSAPLTTAPASLRVVNPVSSNLTFSIDARNADRASNAGGKGCPGAGLAQWTDLTVSSFPGTLTGFVDTCGAGSGWAGTGAPASPFRLVFDGVDDYVTYGAVNSLQKQTVLAWIRKTGTGTPSATSGSGGLLNIVPIITKGTNENESDAVDINYYLGIASGGQLASDYEQSPGSVNAPLTGATVLASDTWYMIGMTLDVSAGTRSLWLNAAVDATTVPALPPSTGSSAQFLIGGSRATTGATAGQGRFMGDVAVVLTYDRALTAAEIEKNCHSFSSRFGMLTCPN